MGPLFALSFALLGTAQAADEAWVAWEQFRSRLETADSVYIAATLHDVGLNPWSFVVRARREGPQGPQIVAMPYFQGPSQQYYWDGQNAWVTSFEMEPEQNPAATSLAGPLVDALFDGLPNATVEERDPNADGFRATPPGPTVWLRMQPAEPMPPGWTYVYLGFSAHRPFPLESVVLGGASGRVRIAISHLEWDVPIRDSAFVATYTQPVALPPMECWGNLRCNLDIPEELEGRVLPNRQTVGRIVDVERGFFGLDTNGAQVLCHFPPGFQDHAHSLAVRPGNVKDHLAHGDQLHACPGQPDARPDPEDPPGVLTICHIPPGNNQAGRQLQLPPAAIPGHLNHGDHLGPCRPRAATAPPGGRPRAATEPNPAGPLPDPAGGEPPADAATGCFGCRTAQGPGWGAWGALAILLARRRR